MSEVMEPGGLSTAAGAPELHVTPTHGPAADKGAECNADTGNAAEALKNYSITAVESGPMAAEGGAA